MWCTSGVGPYAVFAAYACTRCRNCIEVCPSYLATGDVLNTPMGRLQLVRKKAAADVLYRSFRCVLSARDVPISVLLASTLPKPRGR